MPSGRGGGLDNWGQPWTSVRVFSDWGENWGEPQRHLRVIEGNPTPERLTPKPAWILKTTALWDIGGHSGLSDPQAHRHALGAEGRGFESLRPDQKLLKGLHF